MGKTIGVLALLAAGTALSALCADAFSDYQAPYKLGRPILAPSGEEGAFDRLAVDHPKLFWHDGRFYLSYLGFDGISYQTGLAVSDDLVSWRKLGIVFARGESTNEWDRLGRVVSGYLRKPGFRDRPELVCRDGRYYLTYHAYPGKGYESGAAANGLAWAERPDALKWHAFDRPILTQSPEKGRWDSGGLYSAAPCIRDGKVCLYYTAKDVLAWPWHEQVGLAFAEDGTLTRWRRYEGNPVCRTGTCPFSPQFCGGVDVQWDDVRKQWVRYFMGFDRKHARVGVSVSPDGIRWTDSPTPVIDVGGPGSLDETHAHKVASVWFKGELYLIYCAVRPLHGEEERRKFRTKAWNEFRCLTVARSRPW